MKEQKKDLSHIYLEFELYQRNVQQTNEWCIVDNEYLNGKKFQVAYIGRRSNIDKVKP